MVSNTKISALGGAHLMDKKIAGVCSMQEPVGQEPSE